MFRQVVQRKDELEKQVVELKRGHATSSISSVSCHGIKSNRGGIATFCCCSDFTVLFRSRRRTTTMKLLPNSSRSLLTYSNRLYSRASSCVMVLQTAISCRCVVFYKAQPALPTCAWPACHIGTCPHLVLIVHIAGMLMLCVILLMVKFAIMRSWLTVGVVFVGGLDNCSADSQPGSGPQRSCCSFDPAAD